MKILIAVALLAASLAAQTPVDGVVIDSVTGAPVSGAYIVSGSLYGDQAPITDSAGHFRVQAEKNSVYVAVSHNGYLNHQQGYKIEPGETPAEIRVMLVPQGVISGRVMDENGLPVRGAPVSAMRYRGVNGERRLEPWRILSETNELGEYRITELPPGRYYLGVAPGKLAEWDPRYTARFYPDETEAERAQPIDVKAGDELGGRDFRLTRREGVTITGHLVWPEAAGGKKQGVPLHFDSTEYAEYSLPVERNGDSFMIAHVPSGNYTLRTWWSILQARIGDPMGDLTLRVGTVDVRDVSLEIRPIGAQDIAGTVVFTGNTKPGQVTIRVRRQLAGETSAVTNEDGSFVLKGLLPGSYLGVQADDTSRSGLTTIAAQLGDRDVLWEFFDLGMDSPGTLKITMASAVAKLTGKLLDAEGRPVNGGQILFLSSAGVRSEGWVDSNGTLTASVMAAGEHRVYVIPGPEEYDSFRDPDFLAAHRDDFPPVEIVEGANAPLVLRMPRQ
jgi:protocatechuate 3,4-dioxygenase beta subunit